MLVPVFGNAVAAEDLMNPMARKFKKELADAALNAATKAGASYCDVRIGRYLNQFITTRDTRVENIVNTESTGVGVRVIANGAYGFAATNALTVDAVADAAPGGRHCARQRAPANFAGAAGASQGRG
jgi:TldD protein